MDDHESEMIAALEADLHRHKQESLIVETEFMKNDLRHILYNLNDWVKPEKVYYLKYILNTHILFFLLNEIVARQTICEFAG